jgi:DNA polymerase III delta prime subunit
MRPSSINAPSAVDFWAEIVVSRQPISCGRVELSLSEFQGEYCVVQGGQVARIRPKGSSDQHLLDQLLAGGSARLAYVNKIDSDGKVNITTHFFYGALQEFGDVEIGIDENLFKPAIRLGIRYRDTNDLAKKLLDRFVIPSDRDGHNDFFMLEAGREANDDFASDEQTQSVVGNGSGVDIQCFSLIGDGIRIPVRKRTLPDGSEIFFAHRLSANLARSSATTTRLASGHLRFTDYTKTGAMKALAAGAMSRLVKTKDSYLSKWDAYGDIEGGLLLARMRTVGGLKLLGVEPTPEGTRLILQEELRDEVIGELGNGSEIEILSEIPDFINNVSVTWADFIKSLEQESQERRQRRTTRFDEPLQRESDESESDTPPTSEQTESYFKVVRTDRHSIIVDKQVPPDLIDKWIVLSVKGDMVQIERRMEARRLILAGGSANPLLGMIIEENSDYPAPFRHASLQALNYFVKNKVFKGEPTLTQEKAIGIALNTPDIVVIQGPPGTGKTTVISAIIERLNQEHDKTKSVKGEILVSGFQHDAVENIISRLSVNALPPVKFGHRSGQDADLVAERIGLWCQDLATRVREKNPLVKQSEQRRRLGELSRTYIVSPSRRHAVSLLQQITTLPVNLLGSDLLARTHDLIATLEEEAEEDEAKNVEKLHAVRALRVTHQGFLDDGPDTAQAAREYCVDELQDHEDEVLRKAVLWESGQALDFLEAMPLLKTRLLRLYTPRPAFQIEKARNDVLEHVASVTRQLEISTRQNTSNPALPILADFLFELECNPNGVIEAVEDYNYVYAATCQQAQGSAIRRAKQRKQGASRRQEPIEYDTVIVDEAARVSPRDLLIPMAQGRRRIILVGDHRQLPHLVDDEIADQLQDSVGPDESDFIRKSMFEHLIRRLRNLEERDGICRTVTLDEQYRMHPLLGNFVNDQFYRPHGEFFKSPLPAERFEHHLSETGNAPLAWMEVPRSDGQAKRTSGSWRRPCEAARIAAQLHRWIDSPEGAGLSFGIITFYRAQTFAIYEALEQYGFTKQGPDGEWGIDEKYRFLQKAKERSESVERLRIGTVDAFQGMEFDVVFLSITRSLRALRGGNDQHEKSPDTASVFGRIMSENLQCVSMSRQKRLLVVAGDSELLKHPLAEKSIPALCALRALCEKKGVVL